MAGIEEAFEKFVTRVSSGEEPQSEYGDPQTGEKRIPLMQGIKRGYDFENTMPNYYNQRYDYENETPVYNDDRYNIPQQELMGGGVANMFRERPGYAFGGMMKQALSQIGDQLAEKLPPEQQEAIVKANQSGGGIGSIFRSIISRVADAVKNKSTATPAAGLAISLDRPVQSGDPIGSYYANPNNPALASVAPPTTNPLTRPLSTAGFYGSEIFDILKRLGFNFADGGRVSMSEGGLTTTVPPAKGPDSQGVESLFRRRYI
jgi:hypothetical protein